MRGIDLTIAAGEYVAIIGANGSGKSTLARHLNGLLLPSQGSVHVVGDDTRDPARLRAIHQTVQMVFQQPDMQIVATVVEEDVAFGPENFGVAEAEIGSRVREALETVGMWAYRQRPPHLLSAGQKQRVAIAGALAVRPQALVLDEATAMLDPAGQVAVLATLQYLHAQGTTIVTITHEMDEAAQASRVVVLEQGRVAMDGAPHEVFGRAAELRRLGLDVPPVTDLALRLGLPACLTVSELLQALGECRPFVAVPGTLHIQHSVSRNTSASIIQVRGLRHTYLRGLPFETDALREINLDVAQGEITGLIGQTGSGKSTLLQHLNGLIRPQAGHVVVDGRDLADPATDVRIVRRTVGLLFQQPEDQLFERYVGDDVAFGPRHLELSRSEVRERVATAMAAVGLDFEAFKDRLTRTLSGGEQRRAALAGVLALQPRILVADEPTVGLDPHGRAETLGILQRLNREGTTIVLASHRLGDIAVLCDHVVALAEGRVVATGSARQVLGDPTQIARHGLPVPPMTALAARLRGAGWPVPLDALTVNEIEAALAK